MAAGRRAAGEGGRVPETSVTDGAGWRVGAAPAMGASPIVVAAAEQDGDDRALVDGRPLPVCLDRRDETRAVLVEGDDAGGDGVAEWRTPILFGPARVGPDAIVRRELVVDGWRVEVTIEQERRAALRERARRTGAAAAGGGPVEVRAIIPGKIVAVDVRVGDTVSAGQRVLVIEAMKMQNELAAPREGTVELIAVETGTTVERDDLLMRIR